MSNLMDTLLQLVRQRWWLVGVVSSAVAITAVCVRVFEPEAARLKRAEQKKKKDLRALVDKIATYGRSVRQQFPNGAVVVSEHDLAEQLRKRPDSVVTALNVLLKEQKVQRTQLTGYWQLNS
jgi:regulator of extracellular matrix RemA (YlzA/DUF370 family)